MKLPLDVVIASSKLRNYLLGSVDISFLQG